MSNTVAFSEELAVSTYTPENDAEFSAYMDIQQDVEDFIPFDEEITTYINKNVLKNN